MIDDDPQCGLDLLRRELEFAMLFAEEETKQH